MLTRPHDGSATRRSRVARHGSEGGFTLFELIAVMIIMVMILSVSLPNLWPSIAFAGLEGQSQFVANYGRECVARCTLMRERYMVKFDFKEQRLWAEHLPSPASMLKDGDQEGGEEDALDPFAELDSVDPLKRAEQLRDHMEAFKRANLEILAENAKHSDLGLDEIGPDFKDFELEAVDEEDLIVMENLLTPHRFPDGVRIDSIVVGSETFSSGIAEIEVLPLGLSKDVTFHILDIENDEYYTVVWDAITGGARITPGKETAETVDDS